MDKTKIDWCDSTWNPVTGCLHGCRYCYARGIANRFSGGGEKWSDDKLFVLDDKIYAEESEKAEPYPYGFMPTLHRYRMDEYTNKKGRNIFVCSMADLFGKWVPDTWIQEVFDACAKAPQHNYLFLTKNPGRYIELINKNMMPAGANMWYGYSVTQKEDPYWWNPDYNIFASAEPLLEPIDVPNCKWLIVGAETGHRKDKVVPKQDWIESLVKECRENNIPIFMKSSLKEIWKSSLIQQFPPNMIHSKGEQSDVN